jgi:hypothetical protein
MEVTALKGSSGGVQHFADRIIAVRGVRYGRVAMVPTSAKMKGRPTSRLANRLGPPVIAVQHYHAHVQPYEFFAEEYRKPVAISGFEPIDVLQSILMLVRQLNEGASRWRTSISARSPVTAIFGPSRRCRASSNCGATSNGAASVTFRIRRFASRRLIRGRYGDFSAGASGWVSNRGGSATGGCLFEPSSLTRN